MRTHKVIGIYDDLALQGRIIRKDQAGLRILLDLAKQDKAAAIAAIKDVLAQLAPDGGA